MKNIENKEFGGANNSQAVNVKMGFNQGCSQATVTNLER